ncbi:MAG: C10 family peptidase [Prevotella sp.]|nr:C10 family peptidase [Prevotella sp.]
MKITPQEALARLQPSGMRKAKGGGPTLSLAEEIGDAAPLYVFGDGDGNAIVTTSDSELPAIIGVCEDADFSQPLPPSLIDWLGEYEREVEWYQNAQHEPLDATGAAQGRVSTPAMIKTTWAQGTPYNQNLTLGGKKSVTGCNATAISQIMLYWARQGYVRGCTATPEYTTATNKYKVAALPPITAFDFANMTNGKPTTTAAKKAIAQLMEYVGKAVQSDYAPDVTLARLSKDATVLRTMLRMGDTSLIYASSGASKFEQRIYDEITKKQPVLMAGWRAGGGGHTFVCDGYDAPNDMYHVNWGWGSYNGYFKLSALNPTASLAYNSNRMAVVGIRPKYKLGDINGDGVVDVVDAMQVMQDALHNGYNEKSDINSDGEVTVTDAMTLIDMVLGKA